MSTPEETAKDLTGPQRKALLACVAQDPTGKRTRLPGGRTRALPVDCDARSRGPLVEAGCLGWAEGFDQSNTVTPHGREVAAVIASQEGTQP